MISASGGVLRAGLALKLGQIKLAMQSYLRDRTQQATGTAASYAVAAGLFAAAGIFVIAACLVGITALFRWIEIEYGLFHAFGAIGALLLAIAAVCAGVAASRLKQPPPKFPSLASRLRVAIKANPVKPARVEAARDTATTILRSPPAPVTGAARGRRNIQTGSSIELQADSSRSHRRRDAAGLGRRAAASDTTIGRLMSSRRSQAADDLALIAATAILVVCAQRYFRKSAADPARVPADAADAPHSAFAGEIAQRGRGRLSLNPLRIPLAGWKDILWRTYQQIDDDRLLATAAGVVFFGLLAVFPAITALVSSYGLFADASTIGANLQTLARDAAAGLVPDRAGPDRARAFERRHHARRDLPVRPRARDLERQCRRQGGDRGPQRGLWGARKTQLLPVEPAVAGA